jgi:hypothetical protein
LDRHRLAWVALALAAAAMSLTIRTPQAFAAAEEHRFNLVLSATPSSIDGGSLNDQINRFNIVALRPGGRESLDKLTFGWLFQGKASYLVRQNLAVSLGVGQIRSSARREYLPALQQSANVSAELISVPVDLGLAYYMAPYNQGDFRARAFVGGGVTSAVYNRATFEIVSSVTDPADPLSSQIKEVAMRDAPGWYGEVGVHMFFASRFSILLSGLYRELRVDELVSDPERAAVADWQGKPFSLDLSGAGVKGAVGIGF